MRYADLFETPIGDISKIDMDAPQERMASFDTTDRRLINHPTMDAKLRRLFEKAPVVIDLAFIQNFPKSDGGKADAQKLMKLKPYGVVKNPNTITIVLTENVASRTTRIPMTPWMIGHRFCHSLLDSESNVPSGVRNYNLANETVATDILGKFFNYKRSEYNSVIWNSLGTFGAARDNKVNGVGEFAVDSMVQYLSRGKITFNVIEFTTQEEISKLESELETFFLSVLKNAVGEVFVY